MEALEYPSRHPPYWVGRLRFERGALDELESPSRRPPYWASRLGLGGEREFYLRLRKSKESSGDHGEARGSCARSKGGRHLRMRRSSYLVHNNDGRSGSKPPTVVCSVKCFGQIASADNSPLLRRRGRRGGWEMESLGCSVGETAQAINIDPTRQNQCDIDILLYELMSSSSRLGRRCIRQVSANDNDV
ncbi:hypothetical protein BHM03_00036059 [Ensete ventricosum]|nr:hypothetical protein BHM03_00036059 [Ensete ventricosum]